MFELSGTSDAITWTQREISKALTWRRLNYGRSRPAIRYVTYLPATIDYAENTRLSPPGSTRTRLDFRLDRGENLRAHLGYLYHRQSCDFLIRPKTSQRPISHKDLLHSLRRTLNLYKAPISWSFKDDYIRKF